MRGPLGSPPAGTWEGSVSKHAMPRSQRLGHLKVAATAVLVVAFVTLFVGGATGMIGARDDGDGARRSPRDVGAQRREPATTRDRPRRRGHRGRPTPTDEPTEVVTDVPPQDVKDAKKLKRSLAWLRRGLADETTFRVGTFNVLGSSHTAKVGGNKQGLRLRPTRMGMAYSLISQADLDVIGFQEFEEVAVRPVPVASPARAGTSTPARPSTAARSATRSPGAPTCGSWSRPTASRSPTSAAT